jgi:xylulokinase
VSLVLAVDLGTSAVKAAVIDEQGRTVSEGKAPQRVLSSDLGAREHDPRHTWQATRRAISSALSSAPPRKRPVGVVVVTGPRGTFCFMDKVGRPLTNFVTWQDQRGAALADELSKRFDPSRYQKLTGMAYNPFSALSKILWMLRNHPDLDDVAAGISTPQGHVLRELGATIDATEPSTAAHMGLLDIRRRRWSEELIGAFDLGRIALPRIVKTGAIVGTTSARANQELGIPCDIPLVLAGSDGICQELGLGVIDPGQVYAYLGTASAIAGPIPARAPSPQLSSLTGGVIRMPGRDERHDRLLGLGGAGASAADWISRVLRLRRVDKLDELAHACEPGASGMLFLPTLAGAAAPEPEPAALGSFVGLAFHHGPEHFARSVLEGVAMELRWMLEGFRAWGLRPSEVRLTGGGARSLAWRQIVADVLQMPVLSEPERETGLRGAAIFAYAATTGVAVDNLATQWQISLDLTQPSPAVSPLYERTAANYRLVRQVSAAAGVDRVLFDTSAWIAGDNP